MGLAGARPVVADLLREPGSVPRVRRSDVPPPSAENAATATDVVKGGKFLREHQRVPLQYDVERHCDQQLFSALGRDRSDEDPFGMTS